MSKKGQFGRITESNVDDFIQSLMDCKGDYIIQSVSFNKHNPLQLELLRMVLLSAPTFSGFIKDVLTMYKSGQITTPITRTTNATPQKAESEQSVNTDIKTALLKRSKNNMNM